MKNANSDIYDTVDLNLKQIGTTKPFFLNKVVLLCCCPEHCSTYQALLNSIGWQLGQSGQQKKPDYRGELGKKQTQNECTKFNILPVSVGINKIHNFMDGQCMKDV